MKTLKQIKKEAKKNYNPNNYEGFIYYLDSQIDYLDWVQLGQSYMNEEQLEQTCGIPVVIIDRTDYPQEDGVTRFIADNLIKEFKNK